MYFKKVVKFVPVKKRSTRGKSKSRSRARRNYRRW